MKRPELVSYLDYREFNGGKPSSLDEFQQELKKFPRNPVVRLCAAMNTVVATWRGDFDLEVQWRFVRTFFPPQFAESVIATNRPVFHRQQLLFVIQQAFLHCTIIDGALPAPYVGGFGKVLLMASDHLHIPMPEGLTETPEKAAHVILSLLPSLEANNFTNYLNRAVRSSVMISRFIEPLRGKPIFFDVPALLEQATGVPLDTYRSLIWASMSRFSKVERLRSTQEVSDFSVVPEWYGTHIPKNYRDSFLADISAAPDEFSQILTQKVPHPTDFTVLRDKPFINDAGRFFSIDFTFLSDKLESGVFWRVHNNLRGRREKEDFHNFWGQVFEQYSNWIFEQSCTGNANRFFRDPRFGSNPQEQVCDGLIVCGRAAILMEYKGSTFTAASKYGGDVKVLKKELEDKLVGEPNRRKGVRQLAHAVERLCRRENPDAIQGVDMAGLEVLLPVVITRDDIGSAWGTNAYLNARFQELKVTMNQCRQVTSLFCFSANDVEMISSYLPDTSLAELLFARHAAETPLMASFWTAENSVIDRKGLRKPEFVYDGMKELTKMTSETLGIKPPTP
jgi:hypothetical protein